MVKDRKNKPRPPAPLGSLLDTVLGRFGLRKRVRENEVFLVWEDVVGEAVTRNCRPKSIADGVLVIETRDNVWMQELSLLRQGIVEKINELLGWEAVREIRFRIGPLEDKPEKTSPRKPRNRKERRVEKISPETELEIEQALKGIADGELKEALRALMIMGVKRSKSRNRRDT